MVAVIVSVAAMAVVVAVMVRVVAAWLPALAVWKWLAVIPKVNTRYAQACAVTTRFKRS